MLCIRWVSHAVEEYRRPPPPRRSDEGFRPRRHGGARVLADPGVHEGAAADSGRGRLGGARGRPLLPAGRLGPHRLAAAGLAARAKAITMMIRRIRSVISIML